VAVRETRGVALLDGGARVRAWGATASGIIHKRRAEKHIGSRKAP